MASKSTPSSDEQMAESATSSKQIHPLAVAALVIACAWAYWPTLLFLAATWDREPDYSHGYLVIPLFAYFLYLRREDYPDQISPTWLGLIVLALSMGLRAIGGMFFITPMDGWSMVFWVAGTVLCLGGWPLLRWSLAPILFLFFMVPLPFRAETLISQPLQEIAAVFSAFLLRCLGHPAFASETTLLVGNSVLEVEQTCSGLRIFVGIFALACGYLIAFRRELWEAILLLLSVIPVALIANALRIVTTAILYQHFTEDAAHKFSHDVAGWLMVPLAALLLGAVQWYLNCLMCDVEVGGVRDVMKRKPAPTP